VCKVSQASAHLGWVEGWCIRSGGRGQKYTRITLTNNKLRFWLLREGFLVVRPIFQFQLFQYILAYVVPEQAPDI
jgi:hypothetical protein